MNKQHQFIYKKGKRGHRNYIEETRMMSLKNCNFEWANNQGENSLNRINKTEQNRENTSGFENELTSANI